MAITSTGYQAPATSRQGLKPSVYDKIILIGADVDPRLAGQGIFYAIEKDIAAQAYTPEIYAARLKQRGFSDESAQAFTQAYIQKDINIAKDWANGKAAEVYENNVRTQVAAEIKAKNEIEGEGWTMRDGGEANLEIYEGNGVIDFSSKIDDDFLRANATELEPSSNLFDFLAKTKNNPSRDKILNHFADKAGERDSKALDHRMAYLNYIMPTIEEPLIKIFRPDGRISNIKPFVFTDVNSKTKNVNFLSIVTDKDGNIDFITAYALKDKSQLRSEIKKGIKVEVRRGLARTFDPHSRVQVPSATGEIISQKGNLVNEAETNGLRDSVSSIGDNASRAGGRQASDEQILRQGRRDTANASQAKRPTASDEQVEQPGAAKADGEVNAAAATKQVVEKQGSGASIGGLTANSNAHLGSGLVAGTLNSVDEEGNFSPERFAAGFLAGLVGSKAAAAGLRKMTPKLYNQILGAAEKMPQMANSNPRLLGKLYSNGKDVSLNSFAGQKAITANVGKLDQAKAMLEKGADEVEIWQKTGWFKDKDGAWKFEIGDSNAKLNPNFQSGGRLGELLEHEELFKAYPELKDVRVVKIGDEIPSGAALSVKDAAQREKRGIYNVAFNNKKSTIIRKDLDAIDEIIKFEKGEADYMLHGERKSGYGALHIQKHLDTQNNGWVTKQEYLDMGQMLRKSTMEEADDKRIYTYFNDEGIRFRVVIGMGKNKERVISFYSNRKPLKAGLSYNSQNYDGNLPLNDDIIAQNGAKGYYSPAKNEIGLSDLGDKSTLMHEVQHAIQEIEDFARGGDFNTVWSVAAKNIEKKYESELVRLEKISNDAWQKYAPLQKEYIKLFDEGLKDTPEAQRLLKQMREFSDESSRADREIREIKQAVNDEQNAITEEDLQEIYRKIHGEAEARNVQNRLNLDRKAHPHETFDVNPNETIVSKEDGISYSRKIEEIKREHPNVEKELDESIAAMSKETSGEVLGRALRAIERGDAEFFAQNAKTSLNEAQLKTLKNDIKNAKIIDFSTDKFVVDKISKNGDKKRIFINVGEDGKVSVNAFSKKSIDEAIKADESVLEKAFGGGENLSKYSFEEKAAYLNESDPLKAEKILKKAVRNALKREANKEMRGIYNVTYNDKVATLIKHDLESVEKALVLEKGSNKKGGAVHIKKHLEPAAQGAITQSELLNIGKNIREYLQKHKQPFIDENGGRIYEWADEEGVKFRVVAYEKADGISASHPNTIISFYSNRNLNKPMKFRNPKVEAEAKLKRFDAANVDKNGNFKNEFEKLPSMEELKQKADGFLAKYESFVTNKLNKLEDKIEEIGDKGVRAFRRVAPDLAERFNVQEHAKEIDSLIDGFRRENAAINASANAVGKYLKRFNAEQSELMYKALDGQISAEALPENMRGIYGEIRKLIDHNADRLVELGVLKKENAKKDYIGHFYDEYLKSQKSAVKTAFDKFYARKDLSEEQKKALGLRTDISFVAANTLAKQRSQIAKAELLKTIAGRYSKDEIQGGAAQGAWVRISDESAGGGVKKYGALAGKYVPEEIASALRGADMLTRELGLLEKVWYPVVDHIKVNVTVKNPVTHLYNFGSNAMLAYLHGDEGALIGFAKLSVEQRKAYWELGKKLGLGSAMDDLEGVAKAVAAPSKDGLIMKGLKNLYMAEGSKTGDFVRKAYAWEDEIFKIARFKKNLDAIAAKKGIDASDFSKFSEKELAAAMKDAQYHYVDYSTHFNGALKVLDKTGIAPFLHYAVKSTPMVIKAIAKKPHRFLMLQAGLLGFGEMTGIRLSAFDGRNEDDNLAKPGWAESGSLPNLFGLKSWAALGDSGWFFNAGRLVPGFRFDGFDSYLQMGFIGGAYNIVNGKSPLGYNVGSQDDGWTQKTFDRVKEAIKNYMPPLTIGRYAQQIGDTAIAAATGLDVAPKDYNKDPLGVTGIGLRALGVRKFNPEKEYKNELKKAKKEYERFVPVKVPEEPVRSEDAEKVAKAKEKVAKAKAHNEKIAKLSVQDLREAKERAEAKFKRIKNAAAADGVKLDIELLKQSKGSDGFGKFKLNFGE